MIKNIGTHILVMILLNAKSNSFEKLKNGRKCNTIIKIDDMYFKMFKF